MRTTKIRNTVGKKSYSRKELTKFSLKTDSNHDNEDIKEALLLNPKRPKPKFSSSFIHKNKIVLNTSHQLTELNDSKVHSSVQLPLIFHDKVRSPIKLHSSTAILSFKAKNEKFLTEDTFSPIKPVNRRSSKYLEHSKLNHFNISTKQINHNSDNKKVFCPLSTHLNLSQTNSPKIVIQCKDTKQIKEERYVVYHHEQSQPGLNCKGEVKTNQDNYVYIESLFNLKHCDIFGVFDGHGINGHHVSDFIKRASLSYFNNERHFNNGKSDFDSDASPSQLSLTRIYKSLVRKNYKQIHSFFNQLDSGIKEQKFDIHFSGSTSVIVFRLGKRLICANVGDSRAILVKKDIIEHLSIDHKPSLPKEKSRIESKGGEVHPCEDDDGDDAIMRVWVKGEDYPGIAVSRSIGDEVASTVGVDSTPEIIEKSLEGDEKFIVVASDGIWEFLSNERVKDIVTPFYVNNDPSGACEKLIEEASKLWENDGSARDDITCILYFFPNNDTINN